MTRAATRSLTGDAGLAILIFALATLIAALVIRPFHVGAVGSDTASTVLYFDRIASGQRLEVFLGTTPKPFLTFVYGPLYALTHDWRAISWLAIVVFGSGVAAATVLVRRETRSLVGTVFVATALLASAGLLRDASLAYGGSWCLLAWAVAGLAVTAPRPRYAVAGIALAVGGLIRPESLLIVGAAGIALAVAALAARRGRLTAPPSGAWWILIGLAAIPLAGLHDVVLAGDPFYSLRVPVLGTDIRPAQTSAAAFGVIRAHLVSLAPLGALAVVGLAVLAVRRRWPLLIGLLAIGPGVAILVLGLAARRVFVLDRYLLPVDLAVIVAAGVGLAALSVPVVAAAIRLDRRTTAALGVGLAAGVALALGPTIGPLDRTLLADIGADRTVVGNLAAAAPTLDRALDAIPDARARPARADPTAIPGGRPAILLVPARVLPMAAVELDLTLDRVVRSQPQLMSPDGTWPAPGQLVLHDGTIDSPAAGLGFLEVDQPSSSGRIRVIPLSADVGRQLWVLRIESP